MEKCDCKSRRLVKELGDRIQDTTKNEKRAFSQLHHSSTKGKKDGWVRE